MRAGPNWRGLLPANFVSYVVGILEQVREGFSMTIIAEAAIPVSWRHCVAASVLTETSLVLLGNALRRVLGGRPV